MLHRFERFLKPTAIPERPEPPAGLVGFLWHFARQAKPLFIALFVVEFFVALTDAAIPWFMGRIVTMVSEIPPDRFLQDTWPWLVGMALVVLVARPAVGLARYLITNQATGGAIHRADPLAGALACGAPKLVVLPERLRRPHFQPRDADRPGGAPDAGHLGHRSLVRAGLRRHRRGDDGGGRRLADDSDPRPGLPATWRCCGTSCRACATAPRSRSEARSALVGRIVDSYTNILTVKLFARPRDEDNYVRDAVDRHTDEFLKAQRLLTWFGTLLHVQNALLIAGAGAIAILLWQRGAVEVGAIAMVLPLTLQLTNMSRQIAVQIADLFEEIGIVQEGMMTIARPLQLVDPPDARPLVVREGNIAFEDVRFGYGRETGVLDGFKLNVRPGEKIGLVGRSGAGKSTVVNLLLRFFDLEEGRILIDGQDISRATQESLRAQISVVTQDTSLLHRSIRENIRYGKPDATEVEIVRAAELAHAHEFIASLEDWRGRRGYDAQVGERGVKLSGGQRQRVAIARVILKNAPILVLDEATSALDSEVEAAIQQSLGTLMAGKSVIAIAHRLSTIARMDRLIVLDRGRIVEQGTHDELLRLNGHYAALWRRQSGGFIDTGDAPLAAE